MSFIGKALLISAMAALSAVGCSKSSDDAATATPTMAISGTMAVSMGPLSVEPEVSAWDYVRSEAAAAVAAFSSKGTGHGEPSTQAACSDGYHYRVLCSAWSTPPVSAYGDVACSGGSGGFTVSGLPLNTEISCFIRKSSDGSSFVPFATLELPATSMSGGTDTIVSSGDMALTVSVSSSTGAVTVAVTSGTNNAGTDASTGAASVDPSSLTGYYNMSCPEGRTDTVHCKCFILGTGDKETCISSSAAGVTATAMTVNLSVYKAVVGGAGADFDGDTVAEVPAGTAIFAGTIWEAQNGGAACTSAGSCTSARSGAGESLPDFGGALDWSGHAPSLAAAAAITWAASPISMACSAGGNVNVVVGATPASNATRLQWLQWLQAIVDSYSGLCDTADGGGGTGNWNGCDAGVPVADRDQDAFCVGNFLWQVYQNAARDNNLPRLRWDWSQNCDNTGCSATIASKQLMIQGVEFNGLVDASTPTFYSPSPEKRFMFDQWMPNAAGTGGSMKERGEDFRSFQCSAPPTGVACAGGAAGNAAVWAECATGREMIIKFIPGTAAGTFNVVFNETSTVRYGKYKGGGAGIHDTDAYAACSAYLANTGTVPQFVALATKL